MPCILQGTTITFTCQSITIVISHVTISHSSELGVGILYFALVSSLWWLALCLSVFDVRRRHPSAHLRVGDTHRTHVIGRICQMVYLRRSVHLIRKWHIPYHFIAWGLPLCAVIAGFAGTVRLPCLLAHTGGAS